jgi:hypothetical protein
MDCSNRVHVYNDKITESEILWAERKKHTKIEEKHPRKSLLHERQRYFVENKMFNRAEQLYNQKNWLRTKTQIITDRQNIYISQINGLQQQSAMYNNDEIQSRSYKRKEHTRKVKKTDLPRQSLLLQERAIEDLWRTSRRFRVTMRGGVWYWQMNL